MASAGGVAGDGRECGTHDVLDKGRTTHQYPANCSSMIIRSVLITPASPPIRSR